jgi:hypothetical protein
VTSGLQTLVQHVTFPHIFNCAQNVQEDSNNNIVFDSNQHKTSLKVNVCGWLGNDQTRAVKMSDIVYAPTAKYNMFSLTKCLKQGWQLRGDESKMSYSTMILQLHLTSRSV